ncbi:MAG: ATP-dependent Clp protease proteolytic subunit [Cyanobacteria bacterium]|nr:ATP-dependent Clp protease proteolytic subunit [Cyanobacteriota bacterium]
MPNWNDLLDELKKTGGAHDVVRRKYLLELHNYTGRNTIAYYSGWLQKENLERQGFLGFGLNDNDKNGFMTAVHKLDRSKGLDLILHTPGGSIAATESLVDYLRSIFDIDIRAIVPQLAMSAGTMIACACKEILMGRQSSLGPIDPQIGNLPTHGIIEEFTQAAKEIKKDPAMIPIWQAIIANYSPTLIGECQKAINWSNQVVEEWLVSGMFKGDRFRKSKAAKILAELGDHALTKSHDRHISIIKAKEIGLKVQAIEDDNILQDLVLTVHHSYMHTLTETAAFKIIENHLGMAMVSQVQILKG